MDEELLSKKELLQLTGISYGQLYRWKRQNLIPEEWFIKQSAFTGQETFFPRDKILKRVQMIMELKDQYSLEELAKLLSPEATDKAFRLAELLDMPLFDAEVVEEFGRILAKDSFGFKELVFMYVLSSTKNSGQITQADLPTLVASVAQWLPRLKDLAYEMLLCSLHGNLLALLVRQDTPLYLDCQTVPENSFELAEWGKELNLELNKVWEDK